MNKIMTIYELLGVVRDGKLTPKKIRFENYIYIWRDTQKDYFCKQLNHSLESIIGEYLFNNLNLEIEIIEEKKIPEKLEYYDDSITWVMDNVGQLSNVDKVIIDTLNQVIDYLKSKEE